MASKKIFFLGNPGPLLIQRMKAVADNIQKSKISTNQNYRISLANNFAGFYNRRRGKS